MKRLLTIAGSDCSGGAGIQADLKTFAAHGTFGMSVIVSVVAENTQRVIDIQDMRPDMIEKQMDAIFEDIGVDGVKVGMLSGIETMSAVSRKLHQYLPKNLVIDPVMSAKDGHALMPENALSVLIKDIIPLADVLTPNIPEAEIIIGMKINDLEAMKEAAKKIWQLGAKNVVVKGGHLDGTAMDVLFNGQNFSYFDVGRINTKNTHGTGCTFSSAIAANLANGLTVTEAVAKAKKYITMAIEHALDLGEGHGPTNHFYEVYQHGLK